MWSVWQSRAIAEGKRTAHKSKLDEVRMLCRRFRARTNRRASRHRAVPVLRNIDTGIPGLQPRWSESKLERGEH